MICFILAGRPPQSAAQKNTWQVPEAPLRFTVKTVERPTDPSAGYIVRLPDGGILPQSPGLVVMEETENNRLKHGCLWYDRDHSMVVVFQDPQYGDTVQMYVKPAAGVEGWNPNSGLKPSGLLYTIPRGGNLDMARQLEQNYPPGKGVYFEQFNRFDLGNNPSGRPGPFSTYISGYLSTHDAGKAWVTLISPNPSEIRFDGKKLSLQQESEKAGGTGAYVQITSQPHRMELLHTWDGKPPCSLRAAWRLPKTSAWELGIRAEGQTPMTAARVIWDGEVVKSGKADVELIQSSDGSPVAFFSATPLEYFWFDKEQLILYEIKAHTNRHPKDATYSWKFGNQIQFQAPPRMNWILPAYKTQRIGLTVSAGGKSSSCAYVFEALCAGKSKSDVDSFAAADRYLQALLNMLKNIPPEQDMALTWTPSIWDLFWNLIGPGKGQDLVLYMVENRWNTILPLLNVNQRHRIEDLFHMAMAPKDPKKAAEWVAKFSDLDKRNLDRRKAWEMRNIELLMYYLNNLKEAARRATPLESIASAEGIRAKVRTADIAFLGGEYEKAVKLYGEIQNRSRSTSPATLQGMSSRTAPDPLAGLRKLSPKTRDWRVKAIRDTSVSVTARDLIREGFYDEARQVLDEWELEFPLSKISGDYIVVEAKLLMAIGDYVRADRVLEEYCKLVDVTNYLPEAMNMKMQCMLQLKTPQAKLQAFADEMKKRLKFHPSAMEAEKLLKGESTGRDPGITPAKGKKAGNK